MANKKSSNVKVAKVAPAGTTNTGKIIAIILAVAAVIALLLGLTCCNKDTDPKKLQGKVINDKNKKEDDKKDDDVKDVVISYDNFAEIAPAQMAFTPEKAVVAANEASDSEEAAEDEADTTAPVARVVYSTTDPTNGDVEITIVASEEIEEVTGWTLSSDKLSLVKTVSDNEDGTITITDLAGNTADVAYSVQNIDKVAPTATIAYNPEDPTNGDVVVTITANEKIQAVDGWTLADDELSISKTVSANESASVTITDLAGNTTDVDYDVANIDTDAPTGVASYSTTNPTNQDVVVTITANEKIQAVDGWTLADDELSISKTVSANESASVTITDLAGNTATVDYEVANIDKVAPTATYSSRRLGQGRYEITITCSEEIQPVTDWTLSADKKKLTRTVTQGGSVTITDLAGNTATIEYHRN